MAPCVEGIGHGHIRRMQFHEAFACLVGLAVAAVGLATAHGTCHSGVAKIRLPSAGCLSRNLLVSVHVAMRKSRWRACLSAQGRLQ